MPARFRLAFSADVRELSHDDGRAGPVGRAGASRRAGPVALLGGDPMRLLTLGPRGVEAVRRLRGGADVGAAGAGAGALARSLVRGGFAAAVPDLAAVPPAAEVTVAIPVRDRAAALPGLLGLLAALAPGCPVIVVDDGSVDGSGDVARGCGATVVRHERPGGPAAARNAALQAAATPYVAFVDSDCRPLPGWLDPLLSALADPVVAVAAPRVRSAAGASLLARYERDRSPLDLGTRPAEVRPGGRVPYVPSAALLVRRAAVSATGGADAGSVACFDPRLRHGEDVDLVWRLTAAGWSVRYVPTSVVEHAPRPHLAAWARQRYGYGTSAAPLALRHPGTLRPLRGSRAAAVPWVAAAAGAPRVAAGAFAVTAATSAVRLHRKLGAAPHPALLAARLVVRGQPWVARQLADGLTRGWLPLAVTGRRGRRALLVAAVLPATLDWARRRPRVPLPAYVGLRALDDAAYCAGVWAGCLRRRTLLPLLPELSPPSGGA